MQPNWKSLFTQTEILCFISIKWYNIFFKNKSVSKDGEILMPNSFKKEEKESLYISSM